MTQEVRIRGVATSASAFAAHHGVTLPRAGSRVELGAQFARGGFGVLREVLRLDGAPPRRALVAKMFSAGALTATGGSQVLTARVAELHQALPTGRTDDWCTALLALPFCLVSAQLPDGVGLVALMLDLRALGYRESPFEQIEDTVAHLARPPHERIDLALRYAERAALLERIGFVHSDQNPENLMVTDTDVQIIDLDAGVIANTGNERPLTAGKPDDCMPPEVKHGDPAAPVDLSRYSPAATRWSVASLIGYLLFGAHPAFFLRSISPQTIADYAAGSARWPEVDPAGPLFTTLEHNRSAYDWLREQLHALPEAIRGLFVQLFAAGLDAERRPAAAEWVPALAGLREPPVIVRFEVDETYVVEGREVTVSWSVRNADRVELVGHGLQPPEGELRVVLERASVFEMRVSGPYGARTARTPVIRVLPLPRIKTLPVPELPGLTSHVADRFAVRPGLVPIAAERGQIRPAPRISAIEPGAGLSARTPVFRLGAVLARSPRLHSIDKRRRAA